MNTKKFDIVVDVIFSLCFSALVVSIINDYIISNNIINIFLLIIVYTKVYKRV